MLDLDYANAPSRSLIRVFWQARLPLAYGLTRN
jgi:hypothetical protein